MKKTELRTTIYISFELPKKPKPNKSLSDIINIVSDNFPNNDLKSVNGTVSEKYNDDKKLSFRYKITYRIIESDLSDTILNIYNSINEISDDVSVDISNNDYIYNIDDDDDE